VCTKTSRFNNASQLVGDSNEQIAASFLKTVSSGQRQRDAAVQLAVTGGGHPLTVTVSPASSVSKNTIVSSSKMVNIQQDLHLSDRETLKLGKHLRSASTRPRNVIASNLKQNLYSNNHRLDSYFVTKEIDFTRKENNVIVERTPRWVVVCDDVDNFLDHIIQQRKYGDMDILIRIGIDGGQGFLKVCVSLFSLNGSSAKSFKDSSVQRIFILAIAPNIQENYENLLKLWVTLNLHNMQREFTIATDLKLCNILLGLMSHGSCHPCCWCSINKDSLHLQGENRTFESMRKDFWKWTDDGKRKREKAKNFNNVVHPSIVKGSDTSITVLEVIPPPELHLFSGPVNTMYAGLAALWPGVSAWIEKCHVVREAMHGGSFTGNSCKMLLSKVDLLQSMCPLNCLKYVEAFRAFSKVSYLM
jgi:hypothetical protein